MIPRADAPDLSPHLYQPHLLALARGRMDRRLRGRLEACDLVQESLLRAHAQRDQCRGQNDAERAAWLRSILVNTVAEQRRKALGPRRDVTRECSLDATLDDPSVRLEGVLADDAPSPSQEAVTREQRRRLTDALAQLPEDQRTALDLHHLQGYSVPEVAAQMSRTTAAAAGLLRRGLQTK